MSTRATMRSAGGSSVTAGPSVRRGATGCRSPPAHCEGVRPVCRRAVRQASRVRARARRARAAAPTVPPMPSSMKNSSMYSLLPYFWPAIAASGGCCDGCWNPSRGKQARPLRHQRLTAGALEHAVALRSPVSTIAHSGKAANFGHECSSRSCRAMDYRLDGPRRRVDNVSTETSSAFRNRNLLDRR